MKDFCYKSVVICFKSVVNFLLDLGIFGLKALQKPKSTHNPKPKSDPISKKDLGLGPSR